MALILGQFVDIFRAEDGDTDEYYFDRDSRSFHKKDEDYESKENYVPIVRLRVTQLYEDYLNITGILYLLQDEIHELRKLYNGDVVPKSEAMLYLAASFGLDDDMNHYVYMITMDYINTWAKKNRIENVKLAYNAFDPRSLENYSDYFIRNPTKEERETKQAFIENEIAKETEDERKWLKARMRLQQDSLKRAQ